MTRRQSPPPPAPPDDDAVARAMAAFAAQAPALPLAVALSGGADSTALLLACAERWPGQVRAWHIHHGLQAAADDFERHCVRLCQRLGVPLQVRRVQAHADPGDSPEDAARRARYQAFDALALEQPAQAAIQTVVIAQHADDQVETVLLALSRGAGLGGLAAMPLCWQRGAVAFWRPLLPVPGTAIRDWLRARGERWIEDPTNTDERFTRNRIRARLLPALEATFPQFRATFARSAAHAAQAQALLRELAAQDLAAVGTPPRIAALQALSPARQTNVLRHWLAQQGGAASTAQMHAVLAQIAACTTRGHRIALKVGAGTLRRQGEVLAWQKNAVHPPPHDG